MPAQRMGAPLHAVAVLARAAGTLALPADDPLGERRRRVAARRLAAIAVSTAASVHGAFGDRPEPERSKARALLELRDRVGARAPGGVLGALGEVAAIVLKLPPVADDDTDWQLGAIAFADEALLRALYDACLELAAVAVAEAAEA